jgi:hypothetical protein
MTLTSEHTRPLTLLRRVLGLDSLVTTANGLIYLAVSGPVSRLLEVPSALLMSVGAFLVVYGGALGYLASRQSPATAAVRTVIVVNGGWVLASVSVLVLGWLEPSTIGWVWIPLQAAVVAGLAAVQGIFLRRWTAAQS